MSPERTRIVEETLADEEEKLELNKSELKKIWQYEYAHVTDESRNLIDSIDDVIKKSIEDVNLEEFIMDADVIDDLFNNPDPKKIKALEKELIKRFKRQQGNPKFKALSERLEELRDRAQQGLISSIEFVKELCKLAKETLETEAKVNAMLKALQNINS